MSSSAMQLSYYEAAPQGQGRTLRQVQPPTMQVKPHLHANTSRLPSNLPFAPTFLGPRWSCLVSRN